MALAVIAGLLLTFFLLVLALYLPPVQRWAVGEACAWAERETGFRVTIEEVRLDFPLDLVLGGTTAQDEVGDTLLQCQSLKLSIPLRPLLDRRVDVDGFTLRGGRVNTKSLVSDTHVEGSLQHAHITTHGFEWPANHIGRLRAEMRGADLLVVLTDTAQPDTTPSAPWLIELQRAEVKDSRVRLVLPGDTISTDVGIAKAVAEGGYFHTGDARYILKNLDVSTTHLRYAAYNLPALRMRLDKFGLEQERLEAAAHLMRGQSILKAGIQMPLSALNTGSTDSLIVWVDGKLHPRDVQQLTTDVLPKEYASLIPNEAMSLQATVSGTLKHLDLQKLRIASPHVATLETSGKLHDILEDARRGHLSVNLTTASGLNGILHHFAGNDVSIPAGSRLTGTVDFRTLDAYQLNLLLQSAGGSVAIKGSAQLAHETYDLNLAARNVVLSRFVKGMPTSPLSAQARVKGLGYDPMRMRTSAKGYISHFRYEAYPLENTRFIAQLNNGQASVQLKMDNRMMQGEATLSANIGSKEWKADVDACVAEFRPYEVGLMTDTLIVGATFLANFSADPSFTHISSTGTIGDICFISRDTLATARNLQYDVSLAPHYTKACIASGDLDLDLEADEGMEGIAHAAQTFIEEATRQLKERKIDHQRLTAMLPAMKLNLTAGRSNPLAALLLMRNYKMRNLSLELTSSPQDGLGGWVQTGGLEIGQLSLDTIYADLVQDERGLLLLGRMDNYRKDNPNRFTATIDAYAMEDGLGADLMFKDERGDVGIDLGVQASLLEDAVQVHLYPRNPIIAYRRFTLNEDNYIRIDKNYALTADVNLLADDGTGLKIYGEPTPEGNNDVTASVNRLNLSELSSVLLWLPQMGGYLSGDFHITQAKDIYTAMLSAETQDFSYEGVMLGHLGLEALYLPKADNEHYAEAYLSYEDEEVIKAKGSYFNRGEGSFVGDVTLSSVPLSLTDAFLASTGVNMRGMAEGSFHAEGPLSAPVLDGVVDFVDAHVQSAVYGVDFKMDPRPVEVKGSRLQFSDYTLRSSGKTPLKINGTVDATNLSQIGLNLSVDAKNFELINAPRTKESLVFGKLLTDINATVRGTTSALNIRGTLHVLDGTNATYILRDTPVSVNDEFADLVTFMNFADSTVVEAPATASTNIDMHVGIDISDAAKFHCLLSEDAHSYVDIMGGGGLNFHYDRQGNMTLTGRYTIQDGEMKYELPVIPLRTFTIAQGSYVEFAGDMLNPALSIKATEPLKASVSDGGVQRSVRFIAGVDIGGTLEEMNLNFTLDCPDDATIQNDVASMTELQRNKTAVALMATGMYVTDDFTSLSSGFKGSNALNMFLQSSIQGIAGSALKGVDLNFDVGSSSTESGRTTTDYNFQFAKRFWGDRIAVIIGGKVSTGAEASNTAASIIDNVSVEYRLDRGATRYVRLFYDRSAHDALEGNLMETGAGLVLRRKTNRLSELFLFRKTK